MENLERIERLFEQTAILIKENSKEMALLSAKTEAKLKEVGRQLGDIGHSMGDSAEEFFYNSLEENKVLGTVKFDFMSKNVKQKKHRQEDEYDIFMENGNSVGIIEVKQKVKQDHITKLISKKAENFRILFPDYTDYKLYVGIAGLSFEPKAEKLATENGLVVLKQKGDVMQVNSENMMAF
jgi:hypothetical protein